MPHPYDRFADSWAGSRITKYMLRDIDTNPSMLQRGTINTLVASAYAADYAYMAYKRLRGAEITPVDLFGMSGGAGAGGAAMAQELVAGPSGYYKRNPYVGRWKVRGSNTMRRYKRVSKVVRANYRLRKNLPLAVGHEETTEIRSAPATQAVFTFIAERRLPQVSAGGFTGDLYPHVNRDPVTGSILLDADGQPLNRIWRYTAATNVDARTVDVLTDRSDWTMFTNASWRDGYSMLNGRYTAAANAFRGYRTPFTSFTIAALDDAWWQRHTTTYGSSGEPPTFTTAAVPYSVLHCTDYHHLSEELKVTVTNNATTPTTVTLWECILAHDLPMTPTLPETEAFASVLRTSWGGMPCPLELWRASRRAYTAAPTGVNIYQSGAGIVPLTDQTLALAELPCTTRTKVGQPGEVDGQRYDIGSWQQGGPTAVQDIDHAGVKVGGGLLHHWYKVIPHTRVIAPGQTTTLSVHVAFNKRIPGTWWQTLYGVGGYSRAFFMTAKAGMVVGTTGLTEGEGALPNSRVMVNGPIDLTMKWTKRKRFTRVDPVPRRSLYYRAGIPEIDATALRNPEDNDVEGDLQADEVGGN